MNFQKRELRNTDLLQPWLQSALPCLFLDVKSATQRAGGPSGLMCWSFAIEWVNDRSWVPAQTFATEQNNNPLV